MNYLDIIFKSIIVLFLLYGADYAYINVITSDFKNQMSDINGGQVLKTEFIQSILTYVILTFALFYFVITTNASKEMKVINGALLGLCIYGVYEMINGSYIDKWKANTITTHTLWGGLIFGITTFLMSSFHI